jgi:hypothetical protein
MPAESKAQFRWLHTDDAKEKLGDSGVKEWLGATGSPKGLPERKKKAPGFGRKKNASGNR